MDLTIDRFGRVVIPKKVRDRRWWRTILAIEMPLPGWSGSTLERFAW